MNVSPKGDPDRDSFAQIPAAFIPLTNQGLYFDGDLDDPFSRNTLQLRPRSTGGNITFEQAETLAICSQCANITHLLPPPKNCQPGIDDCLSHSGRSAGAGQPKSSNYYIYRNWLYKFSYT